ncbi:MAG: pyruvate, phosphate dikinase [Bacteroidetes bacterium]|nr:MAG: pyruvate, phosphate dikinase [Bacteroidota bacterium]
MSSERPFRYPNSLELLSKINRLLKQNRKPEETFQQLVTIYSGQREFSLYAGIQITYDNQEYISEGFTVTEHCREAYFTSPAGKKGMLKLCLAQDEPAGEESAGKDQDYFLENFSNLLTRYLIRMDKDESASRLVSDKINQSGPSSLSNEFVQEFLNKYTYNRDIYHDLMPFKVREILLISSLYDAYAIEKEGRFSEHMLGQYGQLNLTSIPRITGASSFEYALEHLRKRHFDLIIYMVGVDKKTPIIVCEEIKRRYPYIPIFLLLNNNSDLPFFTEEVKKIDFVDKIFTWNGDASIFFSMIKLLEDKINVENDTEVGKVRVILVVEDSPDYYTRYLSFLYRVVMYQTKEIIEDVDTDELYKVLRMRARPKILLATNFEEATEILHKYKNYMLCLISDVKFDRNGVKDDNAGIELLKLAHKELKNLPTILQSADDTYADVAKQYNSLFLHKQSDTLYQDIRHFLTNYLGFGDFIFKDGQGNEIGRASNLKAFEKQLRTIPDESLVYHASRDHLSMWLMARGEIRAANILNPKKVTDFKSTRELREAILSMIREHRNEQEAGNIMPFSEDVEITERNIYTLAEGALGGKGRGLAFINALINKYDFENYLSDIRIRTPKTFIIGTAEFESFIKNNNLNPLIADETDYEKIRETFIQGKLSDELMQKLEHLIGKMNRPLAVRSSGLFEDSLMRPFAGIFETYLVPNNHPDRQLRLRQLCDAIKLVFASVFSNTARGYVKAIDYKIEEEKMAVVIQEVVGHQYDHMFYPHISGVAQSFNFYPFAHMKPEEGFALAAVGLGRYVVEGNHAYRFSPRYPGTRINSLKDQFHNSQTWFYAVNMDKKDLDLLEGELAGISKVDISVAEKYGTLNHCASVYDPDNNTIYPGLRRQGPRIIDFANILKHNYVELAKTLKLILELGKEAMGTAIEIEYAVDLNRDKEGKASFYLLQIKPLISSMRGCDVDMKSVKKKNIILFSEKGMGNGCIEDMYDLIYVDPEHFDKSKTPEMAQEIEEFNDEMTEAGKKYILIGPGRWGTRDRWIGIPVKWYQISGAKIIVETSLDEFPLDASSGSHFFHNVTTMDVGYFTVQQEMSKSYIKYDILKKQEVVRQGKYFTHIRFKQPVCVRMDGRRRVYVIYLK